MKQIVYVLIGMLAGIISGMGIGGGAILIPSVTIIFGLAQKEAQNVNLIYYMPTAAIALFSHVKSGNLEKSILKSLIIFGVLGALAGSFIAVKMQPDLLRRFFGAFLLVIGTMEFFKKNEKKP